MTVTLTAKLRKSILWKEQKLIPQLALKLNEEFTIPAEQVNQAWSLPGW